MQAKMFCKTGQLAGAKFEIKEEATIGSKSENTIRLHPKIISGNHARIYYDENEKCYFLEDLGSGNGTQLDGVTITEKEKLTNLHIITFADSFDFIFQMIDDGSKQEAKEEKQTKEMYKTILEKDQAMPFPANLADVEAKTPAEDSEAAPKPDIQKTIVEGEFAQVPAIPLEREEPKEAGVNFLLNIVSLDKTFELKSGENVIGRALECDIFIDDPSVSRLHAILTIKSGKVWLKDLKSKNHTFINDNKVQKEIEVETNTNIVFGKVEVQLISKNS